ncbi:cytochrome C biogenesis transmembrane region family protein [Mycobacteroides abscessus MAB_091912_2446]|uniref:Cytochrome C biogenesis transmembrane region family protein n=1 Tax=Mycobacteroides abscessus MAB_091912_2446 TaxID=1335414 RepID=A0A829MGH5_9MYCO|nr:cytochrome C biogenesis transmembrane region family protein [Mycobacteroides abscessus MAB_091912_2446]
MILADAGSAFQDAATSGPLLLALGACALAGLVSFASPCVIPLVPGYLSYLAAVVGADNGPENGAGAQPHRLRVTGSALLFVAGFTAVFLLGTVAVMGMTTTLITNQVLLQRIGEWSPSRWAWCSSVWCRPCNAISASRRAASRRSPVPRCWVRCSRWAGHHAWGRP